MSSYALGLISHSAFGGSLLQGSHHKGAGNQTQVGQVQGKQIPYQLYNIYIIYIYKNIYKNI